jgi:lysophospholipase L1-like esterase
MTRFIQAPHLRPVIGILLFVALFSGARAVIVPASDTRFSYEGRFDHANPAGPVVIWQASRIHIDFDGDSLDLQFAEAKGQNFFDAEIDGRTTLIAVHENAPPRGMTFRNLGPGRHRLTLFKRSEAAAGTVRFTGIKVGADATAFAPEPPRYKLAMLFFGDSITAGACNEDGDNDQWEDRATHNNARSYGAFTAAAFSADYRNIAVSGMGIVTGWTEVRAGQIWDRIYPEETSARAKPGKWTPEIVFVNLGENDDSFTKAKGRPFPAEEFTNGYVALVQTMRSAYPLAHIVILRGGMYGGAQSERLRGPWERAVERLEKADSRVSHFVFQHWAQRHPRVSDHRAMADELIAWLKAQPFMAR